MNAKHLSVFHVSPHQALLLRLGFMAWRWRVICRAAMRPTDLILSLRRANQT